MRCRTIYSHNRCLPGANLLSKALQPTLVCVALACARRPVLLVQTMVNAFCVFLYPATLALLVTPLDCRPLSKLAAIKGFHATFHYREYHAAVTRSCCHCILTHDVLLLFHTALLLRCTITRTATSTAVHAARCLHARLQCPPAALVGSSHPQRPNAVL
jgi:hypothetical protein